MKHKDIYKKLKNKSIQEKKYFLTQFYKNHTDYKYLPKTEDEIIFFNKYFNRNKSILFDVMLSKLNKTKYDSNLIKCLQKIKKIDPLYEPNFFRVLKWNYFTIKGFRNFLNYYNPSNNLIICALFKYNKLTLFEKNKDLLTPLWNISPPNYRLNPITHLSFRLETIDIIKEYDNTMNKKEKSFFLIKLIQESKLFKRKEDLKLFNKYIKKHKKLLISEDFKDLSHPYLYTMEDGLNTLKFLHKRFKMMPEPIEFRMIFETTYNTILNHGTSLSIKKNILNHLLYWAKKDLDYLATIGYNEIKTICLNTEKKNRKFIKLWFFKIKNKKISFKNKVLWKHGEQYGKAKDYLSENDIKPKFKNLFLKQTNKNLINPYFIIKKAKLNEDIFYNFAKKIKNPKIIKSINFDTYTEILSLLKNHYKDKRIIKFFISELLYPSDKNHLTQIKINYNFLKKEYSLPKMDKKFTSLDEISDKLNQKMRYFQQDDFELPQFYELKNNKFKDYELTIPQTNHEVIKAGEILNICVGNGKYSFKILEEESIIILFKLKDQLSICAEYLIQKDKLGDIQKENGEKLSKHETKSIQNFISRNLRQRKL